MYSFNGSRVALSQHLSVQVNRTAVRQPRLDVKDLVELTEYIFRVTAENDAGLGKPSEPSDVVIPKDPFNKPSPPGQPTVDEVGSHGMS